MICKSLLCFLKFWKINNPKINKIRLAKFWVFNLKIVHPPWFSKKFNDFGFKIWVRLCFIRNKQILKINQKAFVLLLIKRRMFFGTLGSSWHIYHCTNTKQLAATLWGHIRFVHIVINSIVVNWRRKGRITTAGFRSAAYQHCICCIFLWGPNTS